MESLGWGGVLGFGKTEITGESLGLEFWGLVPMSPIPPTPSAPLPQFSCSSPALSQPSRSAEPIPDLPFHLGRVLLSLEVYSSEAFAKAQGPCTVSANSRVFVEVTAGEAPSSPMALGSSSPLPHIRLCFLSPSSSSSLDSPYILVRGGCPAHPDVSLHPPHMGAAGRALSPSSQELQRLSFLLRPLYNDSIQFLHCRLALCTQEPQGQAGAYGGALPKVCTTLPDDTGRIKSGLLGSPHPHRHWLCICSWGWLWGSLSPFPTAPLPQGLELPTVVGIVFSAFVIGISLTGGLWLIHSRTGRRGCRSRWGSGDGWCPH
uniref:Transforming growth factor beta receptor 3 like n=1 Tax=Chrysemys picta bellii TaxID=8478 RepID=A0A8C3FVS0_CHRPI